MELTKDGWKPCNKFNSCDEEIRDCLSKYNREQLDAVLDFVSLIDVWCHELSEDYDFKFEPLTVLSMYCQMYFHEGNEMLDELNDKEYFQMLQECMTRHTKNGFWFTDSECDDCHCPDCPIWCELSSKGEIKK